MRAALLTLLLFGCVPEERQRNGCSDPEGHFEYRNRMATEELQRRVTVLEWQVRHLPKPEAECP